MATRLRNRYMRSLGREQGSGERFQSEYEDRALDYDPYEDSRRASMATGERMFEQFGKDLKRLRGSLVGRGRLNTGYGAEDENELYEGFRDRLASETARNSLQASSLALQNQQGIGAYGQAATGRYLDLLAGERDREMMERNYRRQRRGGILGGIGSVVGGIGGALLGGPAGAAAGARIGGAAGRGLGG